jgi:predicted thioesterase
MNRTITDAHGDDQDPKRAGRAVNAAVYAAAIRERTVAVRLAKVALDEGYKKMQAEIEIQHSRLKAAYEMAVVARDREEAVEAYHRAVDERHFE